MGKFSILGKSDVSAGDLQVKNKQVSQGEKQTAKTWLRDFLKVNGPVLKSEVVEEAKGELLYEFSGEGRKGA